MENLNWSYLFCHRLNVIYICYRSVFTENLNIIVWLEIVFRTKIVRSPPPHKKVNSRWYEPPYYLHQCKHTPYSNDSIHVWKGDECENTHSNNHGHRRHTNYSLLFCSLSFFSTYRVCLHFILFYFVVKKN